jgi:hypothetical protein
MSSRNFTRRFVVRSIVSSFDKSLLISNQGRVSRSGMLCALCIIDNKEPKTMNTLLHRKSPFTGSRRPHSERGVKVSERHALALLGFFTTTGLLSVVADVFTNTVPMPAGLRDLWLVICVISFALLLTGITLFFLSYKSKQPSTTGKE